MTLVNYDYVGFWDLPTLQGLHTRDLYREGPIGHHVKTLDHSDVADAIVPERFYSLFDQWQDWNGEDHALSLGQRALDDGCRNQRLSKAGRRLHERPALS